MPTPPTLPPNPPVLRREENEDRTVWYILSGVGAIFVLLLLLLILSFNKKTGHGNGEGKGTGNLAKGNKGNSAEKQNNETSGKKGSPGQVTSPSNEKTSTPSKSRETAPKRTSPSKTTDGQTKPQKSSPGPKQETQELPEKKLDSGQGIPVPGFMKNPVSFFDIRADAGRVVFLIDRSSSMGLQNRFNLVKKELSKTIREMKPSTFFNVIFFDTGALKLSPDVLPATDAKKRFILQEINSVDFGGNTNPLPGITEALKLKPDAIFLLSDGEFGFGTERSIKSLNTTNVPIHTIGVHTSGISLKKIAEQNQGTFKQVQ